MGLADTLITGFPGRLVGREFGRRLREWQVEQWSSRDQQRRRMERHLANILGHASAEVPFYRETVCPGSAEVMEWLRSFPVVDKSVIRAEGLERFSAAGIPSSRRLLSATSGSTGPPFRFYADHEALPVVFASHLFYDSWYGLGPFDRYVRIAVPTTSEAGSRSGLRHSTRFGLRRVYELMTQRMIPVGEVRFQNTEAIYRRLARFRPTYIMGYASSLAVLAAELSDRGQHLPFSLKAVIAIAEPLTADRFNLIDGYFRAPIFTRYGQKEFGFWSAQSCPSEPSVLHINTDLVVPEVLNDDGSPAGEGQLGRLVMTDLVNRAMPLIRYDTGDIAAISWSTLCPCGRRYPLLSRIEGRASECVRSASGEWRGPLALSEFLLDVCGYRGAIRLFQLSEEAERRFVLKVIPTTWRHNLDRAIVADLRIWLGAPAGVRVQLVDRIEPERSGKRPVLKLLNNAPSLRKGSKADVA